jgi:CBS domain-containing protein
MSNKKRTTNNKEDIIKYFYRYSDYSAEAIAQRIRMPVNEVQKIIDGLIKADALEALVEESTARVEKIMTPNIASLDYFKTVIDAATLMAQKEIGSIIVTKDSRPYGIVTERDIIRRLAAISSNNDFYFRNALLGHVCSHPLIAAYRGLSVQDAAEIMVENKIRKLPIKTSASDSNLIGIVTTTDLSMFLSPSRRPGLISSVLQAIARGRKRQE